MKTYRLAWVPLCAALLAACQEEGPQIDVESAIPVRVASVGRHGIAEYVSATGTVEALRRAVLRGRQAGEYQLQTNPRTGAPFAMGDAVRLQWSEAVRSAALQKLETETALAGSRFSDHAHHLRLASACSR